jgi:adenylate cyclase class 2
MAIEHEAKFPLTDCRALEERLRTLGTLREPWHFESNTVYDRDGALVSTDRLLRLRRALVSTLTFKAPARDCGADGVKSRLEHECRVADPAGMDLILRGLGYAPRFTYEKFRAVWTVGDAAVCLDILPFGHFAEIEGPPLVIADLARRLDLKATAVLAHSYHRLHRDWRTSRGLPPADGFAFEPAERHRLNTLLGCEARPGDEQC